MPAPPKKSPRRPHVIDCVSMYNFSCMAQVAKTLHGDTTNRQVLFFQVWRGYLTRVIQLAPVEAEGGKFWITCKGISFSIIILFIFSFLFLRTVLTNRRHSPRKVSSWGNASLALCLVVMPAVEEEEGATLEESAMDPITTTGVRKVPQYAIIF